MTRRAVLAIAAAVLLVGLFAWALTASLERVMRPSVSPAEERAAPPDPAAAPVRHITATLFLGSADAQQLAPVQREVPFGEGAVEQGRQIVLAQLAAEATAAELRVVPSGSTLRGFYVSERGEAFVVLGPEIVTGHTGGSAAELLTVYAIVNAVTFNLPAVTTVQLLIGGREVDTLAGHVDIRRPLRRNDAIVRTSQ
jgi:hypothetical protein